MAGEGGPSLSFNHARSGDESFDFIHGEHDGRKIEACAQPVSHAGLSLDGHTGNREIAYVPINGPFGDFEPTGEPGGGGEASPAQMLHNLEQPIGTPHVASIAPKLS